MQSKLVKVIKGSVLDIALYIRKDSSAFGQYAMVELTEDNHREFFIPRSLLMILVFLSEEVAFQYKCDNFDYLANL